jgi:hypothetical protein
VLACLPTLHKELILAGDEYNMPEPPYPDKRTKGLNGRPQRVSTNTLPSPVGQTATGHIENMNGHYGQPTSFDRAPSTPSRTTTCFDLIRTALVANSGAEGLTSQAILNWLIANCQDDIQRYGNNQKLLRAIQSTLSQQAAREPPTVCKDKALGIKGSPIIWGLAKPMPSVENTSAGKASQVHPAGDRRHDGSEGLPVQGSQVAPVNSAHTMTTQGHDNSKTGSTQTVATECAGVGGREGPQHELSDTSRNVRDIANQMPRTAMKTTATTQTDPVSLVQHRTSFLNESQPGATTTRPDTATSDTGIIQEHSDDHEEQLRLGRLVSRIQDMQKEYKRLKHEIEEERMALPDLKILKENVEQKAEREADLTRLLEEACQAVRMARSDLEVATNKNTAIETAERKLEKMIADSEKLRSKLGIF